MSKVCIDARMWGIKHTGIGRYVENLIDNLPTDKDEVVLIVSPENKTESKLAKFKKYYASYHPYTFMSLLEMGWLLLQIRPDVLHVPHLTAPFFWPGKLVITVHDLIKHYSRGMAASTHGPIMYWIKYLQYLAMSTVNIYRADHIIVPAKYWKEKLIRLYKISPDKITVTYEGVSKIFSQRPKLQSRVAIKQPYVVYTGNLYPHKNIGVLIKAVAKLQVDLAIICARSAFEARLPVSERVHYLGKLTDEDVVTVYSHAVALVNPSLIEGFGLPGLEAMAAGLPVIAAQASCLPEIYGDAVLYFEPHNVDDLAEKIQSVVANSNLAKSLVAKGKKQVAKYSWAKMAKETWQIYQTALR